MENLYCELSQEKWLKINHLAVSMAKTDNFEEIRRIFLEQLPQIIPHKKSFFDMGCLRDGEAIFFEPYSLNMTKQQLQSYYETYQALDYTRWMMTTKTTYRDSQIITEEGRKNTIIYNEWMKPMNVHFSMGSTFFDNGILYGSLTLFRDSKNDFTDEDMYILSLLTEHITANFSCLYPNGLTRNPTFIASESVVEKYHITKREHEIIGLIFNGHSNRDISQQLFITENTVKKHINTIFRKFKVGNRAQLMRILYSYN